MLCSRLHWWHWAHCDASIDMLALHKLHESHRVFLKMNSGMSRLGFGLQRFCLAWLRLNAPHKLNEISLMAHSSGARGSQGIAAQSARFDKVCRDKPGERTLSNSAASLCHAQDAAVKAGLGHVSLWRGGGTLYVGDPALAPKQLGSSQIICRSAAGDCPQRPLSLSLQLFTRSSCHHWRRVWIFE